MNEYIFALRAERTGVLDGPKNKNEIVFGT